MFIIAHNEEPRLKSTWFPSLTSIYDSYLKTVLECCVYGLPSSILSPLTDEMSRSLRLVCTYLVNDTRTGVWLEKGKSPVEGSLCFTVIFATIYFLVILA